MANVRVAFRHSRKEIIMGSSSTGLVFPVWRSLDIGGDEEYRSTTLCVTGNFWTEDMIGDGRAATTEVVKGGSLRCCNDSWMTAECGSTFSVWQPTSDLLKENVSGWDWIEKDNYLVELTDIVILLVTWRANGKFSFHVFTSSIEGFVCIKK